MNRIMPYFGIPVSIGLAYLLIFTVPYAFAAVLVGLPLMFLGRKSSALSGFLIGALAAFSVYLLYPLGSVSKLSGIVSQIISIPGALLIVIFPLMYGIIAALSALLFTGILEEALPGVAGIAGRKAAKSGDGDSEPRK